MKAKEDIIDEIIFLQKELGKETYTRKQLESRDIMTLIVVKEFFLDVVRRGEKNE